MLCGLEVKSEQVSLESFVKYGELFHCPDIGRECQNREDL